VGASPTSACTASRRRCTSRLWIRNVTITTGLVDTYSTPTLLKLVRGHQLDAARFVTHHFGLDEFDTAYDVFSRAGETGALKVVLSRS
jgi:alcohol dehydrogenase